MKIEFDEKEYQTLILAALLHDIVKINQRDTGEYYEKHAEFSVKFMGSLGNFFGHDNANAIANLIEKYYQAPSTRDEHILYIADKLAAAERFKEEPPRFKSNEGTLVAVTSKVKFRKESGQEKYYRLGSLKLMSDALFPVEVPEVKEGVYTDIWEKFVNKVKSLQEYRSFDFCTLFYILKEFGSLIPSATPWEEGEYNRRIADVSLFDHSKVTCAIAACLKHLPAKEFPNEEMSELFQSIKSYYSEKDFGKKEEILNSPHIAKKQIFVLLRGDIAGIQKFIYRITKPKVETKGTSKRLRGRSFYLSLWQR